MALRTVVLDVVDTLSDLGPLARRFASLGAPAELATLWFATTLREGFALAAAGDAAAFIEIGSAVAQDVLSDVPLDMDLHTAAALVLQCFLELPLHPDVISGVLALRRAGLEIATLSNCGVDASEQILHRSGLRQYVDHVIGAEDVGLWKPTAGAYTQAARACVRRAEELVMVSVHRWDVHGAARAGLATAWIDRRGRTYPAFLSRPDFVAVDIPDLSSCLQR